MVSDGAERECVAPIGTMETWEVIVELVVGTMGLGLMITGVTR